MKILQINRTVTQPYKMSQNNPIVRFDQQEDVFVKSSEVKLPSFKGVQQELCKEILGNPKALQKYMAAIGAGLSAAFLALVNGASNNKNSETEAEQFDENMFQNIFASINPFKPAEDTSKDSQIDEFKSRIEQLEKEKEELETQLAQYSEKNENTKTDEPKQEQVIDQEEQNPVQEMNYISFPKKRGRLSSAQEKLKQVVESTQFSEEVSPKVILICEELLKKGCHDVNGENIDNNAIATDFANEIFSNRENQDNLKLVVENYYVKCGLQKDEVVPGKAEPETKTQETGLKIVGKIDLSTIPTRKKKTEIQEEGTTTTKRPRISAGDPNKDFNETTEITKLPNTDKKTAIYKFIIPGTLVKGHIYQNITRLLLSFEKELSVDSETGEKIDRRWMFRHPLHTAITEDVKNEYNRQKNKTNTCKYVNINPGNFEIVADLINSDERYQKLFTLHSAMRFIDRFIDFESDVPIEEQSKENLDCLIETIQNAFKKGVNIQEYEDAFNNNALGAEIVINPDCYSERAREIFGSFPLDITFCEKQEIGYYNKRNKQGVISTIYPRGL
ncbi:MAG: hypothetical protein MJ231_00670 [bacterium]|nr:hypothetical protein [bacterium]